MTIDSTVTTPQGPATEAPADPAVDADALAGVEELLVEEVSIDGMCGVY
jgi:mycofactocin precursor